MSLLLCGCSQKQHTSVSSTFDGIPVGTDIHCGNYVLHFDRRIGSSLEGIRIVERKPDGQTVTITADKGSLSQGSDQMITVTTNKGGLSQSSKYSGVTLILYDAHCQTGTQKMLVDQMSFNLLNLPF